MNRSRYRTMREYKMDLSKWDEELWRTALRLVKDEGAWKYNHETKQFDYGDDLEVIPNVERFRVVSSVGLELLTKAVCVKREIDIFNRRRDHITAKSPYGMPIESKTNQFLKDVFERFGYEYLADIQTNNFHDCINKLSESLNANPIETVNTKQLIESLHYWRELHRNVECHIYLNLVSLHEYEKLRSIYNKLLEVYFAS